ncbi:MAG TPA: alkaline phosphatase D family protein [Mycobacteriales bacterium]|nr:alkaline phosphatase D family protein [Mycobacteriales bacterium]
MTEIPKPPSAPTLSSPTLSSPSRRGVLKGTALGGALALVPLRPFDAQAAEAPAAAGVFGYGVASGDPLADGIMLWTRATPPTPPGSRPATPGSGRGAPLRVRWELAADQQFRRVLRSGSVTTSPDTDHTVKVDVRGLRPYTRYWYRFSAAGQTSPVGRTQTAPDEPGTLHALRFALVSCSNYTGGYFTAYRALARRDDLDFVLHVGDYLYEYPNEGEGDRGRYGPDSLIGVRDSTPAYEPLGLPGYRLRHALHKADPDCAAAHRRHPWITIFDDHEVTNNTWRYSAENHNAGEGPFLQRRAEAFQAYLEWMPLRLPEQGVPHRGTRFFRRFPFGPLGDLSVIETRQNRTRQVEYGDTKGGGFIPDLPALADELADPSRHMAEPAQLDWLEAGVAGRGPWHLVGNQVVFSPVRFPGLLFGGEGTYLNSDQWDGYQADQDRLVEHLAGLPERAGDTVFLTGDIHSSWAIEVPRDRATYGDRPRSAAVELVCPSVTSDGFYEIAAGDNPTRNNTATALGSAQFATAAVQQQNPWVKYLDGVGHGYTLVDVTPDRVHADFYLSPLPTPDAPDPRIDPTGTVRRAASVVTAHGTHRVTPVDGPAGSRSDQPRPA